MKKNFTSITTFVLILVFIVSCTALPHKPGKGNGAGGPRKPKGGNGGGGQAGGGFADMAGGDIGNFSGTSIKDISYAQSTPHNATSSTMKQDLKLDLYFPDVNYSSKKYPLIIWIHGGGFLIGNKSTSWKLCSRAAGNGFVTASIDYRLGWSRTRSAQDHCSGDSTSMKEAIYLAIQDTRAAIRFLVANSNKYSIDTNAIFIAGASAGAVTSLFTKYVTQDAFNRFLPGSLNKFGPVDKGGNNLTNTYSIKGVCSMWGALNDPTLITPQNAVPMLLIQGMKDPVIPFNTANTFHCPNFNVVSGSSILYDRMTNVLKMPSVAIYDPNGGHGVYDNNSNCDNMCTFFKSVLNKTPLKGTYQYNVKLQQ